MGRLASAVILEIFQDGPGLFGREIGADAHVQQNGLPLGGGSLGGIAFRMAAIAVHGIKLGAGKLVFWFLRSGGLRFGGRGDGVSRRIL